MKTQKVKENFADCRYHISAYTDNFHSLDQIYTKRVFLVEDKKNEHHHWILHIPTSLGTNFSLNFSFWDQIWSKAEKVKIITEFCISKLAQVPDFRVNWQFRFFVRAFPVENTKSEHDHEVLQTFFDTKVAQ